VKFDNRAARHIVKELAAGPRRLGDLAVPAISAQDVLASRENQQRNSPAGGHTGRDPFSCIAVWDRDTCANMMGCRTTPF
jgi:hypothetical protein